MSSFIIMYLIYYLMAKYLGLFYNSESKYLYDININWIVICIPFIIVYLIDKIYTARIVEAKINPELNEKINLLNEKIREIEMTDDGR